MKFEVLFNKENSIATLSFIGAISIFPFAILRFMAEEYLVGTIGLALSISTAIIAFFIYKNKSIRFITLLVMAMCVLGSSILVNLYGESIVKWLYPIMIFMYFVSRPKITLFINLATITSVIPKLYLTLPLIDFLGSTLTLVLANFFSFVFAMRSSKQQDHMFRLAWRDGLTGVRNRRALDQRFKDIEDEETPVSLIIIDIDNFKTINDTYGHTKGDDVLIQISHIIQKRIRATDTLYRYGGEEFVIVAINTSIENASMVAEQLRTLIEKHAFIKDHPITVSLGLSELKPEESLSKCFSRGDSALYQAKKTGKNKVCSAN